MRVIELSNHPGDMLHDLSLRRHAGQRRAQARYEDALIQHQARVQTIRVQRDRARRNRHWLTWLRLILAVWAENRRKPPKPAGSQRNDTDTEEKIRAGIAGEQLVATELGRALDDDWTLLRGYRNRRGEIDHLLLGPKGLFAIEVKVTGRPPPPPHRPRRHLDQLRAEPGPRLSGRARRAAPRRGRTPDPPRPRLQRAPPPVAWGTVTNGHPLRLYNSLGRAVADFVPSGDVTGMYSCGPTVYAYQHLGNMRAYVFADTVRRALRWKGIKVRHVVNITDVGHAVSDADTGEDKMEVAVARERRSVLEIAEFYTRVFFEDLNALNVLPAAEYPRASAYVPQMIEFAAALENKGYTYRLPSGLYFDTARDPRYGELARLHAEGQREAARVEHVAGRRNKTDFALWRTEEPGRRRVLRWDSPWGWGTPGWHLECSVMSIALLGPHFDIHTGGIDHRELHHVNEIAQSEAFLADGLPWVRYWLHNEFLQLGGAKMAKSAGGAPRLADLTEAGYHPAAFRLFLLGGHYRSQLDFTTAAIDAAQATLRRLTARVQPLRPLPALETLSEASTITDRAAAAALDLIDAAISADFNTPKLLAAFSGALRDPEITPDGLRTVTAAADALLGLGLATLDPADLDQRAAAPDLTEDERHDIDQLVADRTQARKERDWARADQIRAELDARGVHVTDTPEGPAWQLR